MGIYRYLQNHIATNPVSFHTPGHKGNRLFERFGYKEFLSHLADFDLTEIEGSDNLQQPEGIIRETMNRYRQLYGTKETLLLVNGTTVGLMAAVLTSAQMGRAGQVHQGSEASADEATVQTAQASPDSKDKVGDQSMSTTPTIILARNCHKSVFNGLALAGAKPVYAYPEIISEYGISGEITTSEIERCLKEYPESVGVLITSPNYYGICSPIREIADAVHAAGKVLIVDQAHGAHLPLLHPEMAAENQGADLVINSTHKTMGSLTQSSIANLCSERIDAHQYAEQVTRLESTSPSYLLMASLDINAELMERHGETLMTEWRDNLDYFYDAAVGISGLQIMQHEALDDSKLNLDMSALGLTGAQLEQKLMQRGVYPELSDGNLVMCLTGIGNTREDYERLLTALRDIASGESSFVSAAPAEREKTDNAQGLTTTPLEREKTAFSLRNLRENPLEQKPLPLKKRKMQLNDAAEMTSASALIPYPPGVPVVCPGEVITQEIVEYLMALHDSGKSILGVDEDVLIWVGDESSSSL